MRGKVNDKLNPGVILFGGGNKNGVLVYIIKSGCLDRFFVL